MPELVIVGAGGFGREVFDVVEGVNEHLQLTGQDPFDLLGFVDDGAPDPSPLEAYPEAPLLGPVAELDAMAPHVQYVIGVGAPAVRARLDEQLRRPRRSNSGSLERQSPVLVHPDASIARSVSIGPGTVVCAGARITNNIRIGRHVHVNLNTTIGHDAQLDDYVTLSPLVAISGYVKLGRSVMVGTGGIVNPGVTVGEGAVLGSGAVALKDVGAGVTAVGVPARPRG